jgi:hypothetical protein
MNMKITLRPRRRRRLLVLAGALLALGAFSAAPALANPCPTDSTDPFVLMSGLSATDPSTLTKTQAVTTADGTHNVTVTLTPTQTTGSSIYKLDFSLSGDSPTTQFKATWAYANPTGPNEQVYKYSGDPSDPLLAVTGANDLVASGTNNAISAFKVCLTSSGVSATAVKVRSFTARAAAGKVALRWSTGSELDLLGYNVYGLVAGKRVKLNARLVASKGNGAHAYSFSYRLPQGTRAPSRFWLQSVNLDGSRQLSGARLAH